MTVEVFLRDMQKVWPKANPAPTPRIREAMKELGIDDLKEYAHKNHIRHCPGWRLRLHRYSREIEKEEHALTA